MWMLRSCKGGTAPSQTPAHIEAVAGIYYEPVMVFARGEHISQLSQLTGKKIAIGEVGSGVHGMASMLLNEAGIEDKTAGTTLLDLGGDRAADALTTGSIDAAFYVIAPDVLVVKRLLSTSGIYLMSFDHARAYGRLHPFLSATTLYQGSVSIKKNLPDTDVQLIGSPATVVVRDSTHSAVIELLVRAAQEINSQTTLLSDAGTFPNNAGSEWPVNHDAKYFLKNAPSILHRTLPFWLASMVDRLIILVLPLLVILIPLFRLLPPAMHWREEQKLLTRYRRVRAIEESLTADSPSDDLKAGHDELLTMEKNLTTLKLPIGFSKELYNLRQHVLLVRNRLEGWLNSVVVK